MKYTTTILLFIGAISLEQSQALNLSKKQSHFEQVFGEQSKSPKGSKKKSGKGHKGHHSKRNSEGSASTTTESTNQNSSSKSAETEIEVNVVQKSSDSLVQAQQKQTWDGAIEGTNADNYVNTAPWGYQAIQTHSNNLNQVATKEWDGNMLTTSDYNGYIQDTPISHIAPRTSIFNLQRAPWESYKFKDEGAPAWDPTNTAAMTNKESEAAARLAATADENDISAVQTTYDHWTQENNDVSHNVGYVADQPGEYAVEPSAIPGAALAQKRNKYDIWTKQEHDLHSNVNAYQGDSDPNYVVEPTEEAQLHNPPAAFVQMRNRYDHWTNQEHDLHSNVNAYQGDSPADYLVEPSDYVSPAAPALAQIRNRYDIWTKQEHDLHSNVNAYQGDSDPNYVVEPTADAALHNPPAALAQMRFRPQSLGQRY